MAKGKMLVRTLGELVVKIDVECADYSKVVDGRKQH